MEPSATFGRGYVYCSSHLDAGLKPYSSSEPHNARSRTPSRSLLRSLRPPPALLGEVTLAAFLGGQHSGYQFVIETINTDYKPRITKVTKVSLIEQRQRVDACLQGHFDWSV